jgi:hypothetical protein
LPEGPSAEGGKIHQEVDGQRDEYLTARKNPCAAEKTRVVNRNPLTKDVRE